MNIAREIAGILLETQAVKLSPQEPFKWSSGWNSPIYCDNRVVLSFPEARTFIKKALAETIRQEFSEADLIAGVATAGIAQGALVADCLELPFAYVRPKPKAHGLGNQVEGRIPEGSKIVVFEDLISTGGSSIKVVEALRKLGHQVLGVTAIFNYGFQLAEDNFKNIDVKLITLSNYNVLIEEALVQNYIQSTDIEILKDWRKDPENF